MKGRWMEKNTIFIEQVQVIHPDCVHIYLAVSFQKCFEAQLRLSITITMYVYLFGGILFRHDLKAAVPLQSIHIVD